MMLKFIGAAIIISGCGGFGCVLALNYGMQARLLHDLVRAIEIMSNELRYRLTPLPKLCEITGQAVREPLKSFLFDLSEELNKRKSPDVLSCVRSALARSRIPKGNARDLLVELGTTLGMYDLEGQEIGLNRIQKICLREENEYRMHYKDRTKCYKTLGLCSGIAIAILFL